MLLRRATARRSLSAAAAPVIERLEDRRLLAAIVSGQTLTGTLGNLESTEFTFAAKAGDNISASFGEAVGDDPSFRPSLRILAPNGDELASGINSGVIGTVDSSVQTSVEATSDGIYKLIIADTRDRVFFPNPPVAYNVSLGLGSGDPVSADLTEGNNSGPIQSGQTLDGTLFNGGLAVYTFAASEGDSISAAFGEAAGDNFDFDPFLRIIAPDGEELAFVRNAGLLGNNDSHIQTAVTARLDGIYTFVAGDRGSGTRGNGEAYNISLGLGSGNPVPSDLPGGENSGPIESDQTLEGSLSNGDLAVYTFFAGEGDNISASFGEASGDAFDFRPFLRIVAPDGEEIAFARNSGLLGTSDSNVQASVTAMNDGVFTVVAGDRGLGIRGADQAYRISISGATGRPPTQNQPPTLGGLADSPDPATVGDTLTLTATGAADSDGSVAEVRFFRDDVLLGTDADGSDGYGFAVDTSDLAAGSYTYAAVAVDDDGALSNRVTATNTLQTTPPPPAENEAPTIGSLTDAPDPATVGDDVTLTANGAADSDGRVIEVRFFRETDDGNVPVGIDRDGSDGYAATVLTGDLEPGVYTYSAVAVDDDGARSEAATTINTLVAAPPPPTENQAPTVGGLADSPDPVTVGDDLTLTATDVGDADGSVAKVDFFDGDVLIGTDTDGGDGWSITRDTSGLTPGTYTYAAVATDDDGATSNRATTTNTVRAVAPPPPTEGVMFTLLDGTADTRLRTLADGDVLAQGEVPANPSVQAQFPDDVESVRFELSGPGGLRHVNVEEIGAYTLFKNLGTDYAGSRDFLSRSLGTGDYTLTATSYSQPGAAGAAGTSATIRFTIAADPSINVTGLTLVNADTDEPLVALTDGLEITAADVPTNASILATTAPATVGSVKFALEGPVTTVHTEIVAPYTLFENLGGDYFGRSLPAGVYSLAVTPYQGINATGDAGETLRLTFTILDDL